MMATERPLLIEKGEMPDEILDLEIRGSLLRDMEAPTAWCIPFGPDSLVGFANVWRERQAAAQRIDHMPELAAKATSILAFLRDHSGKQMSMWLNPKLGFTCLHVPESGSVLVIAP